MFRILLSISIIILCVSCSSNKVVKRYVEYRTIPQDQINEMKFSKDLINALIKHFNKAQDGCVLKDSKGNEFKCHKFPDTQTFSDELFESLNYSKDGDVLIYFNQKHGDDRGNYLHVGITEKADVISIYQIFNFTFHEAGYYLVRDAYLVFFKDKKDLDESFDEIFIEESVLEKHKWRYILY